MTSTTELLFIIKVMRYFKVESGPLEKYLSGPSDFLYSIRYFKKIMKIKIIEYYFLAPRLQVNFVVYLSPHLKSSQTEPVTLLE